MNKVKINWIHIIKEHMQKSMRLSDYHYRYAILISKFLHYFEVNLEGATSELVNSTFEVNNGSLSKMGFTKINGKWVSKDDGQNGSSSGLHEHGEEDQEDAEQFATDFGAGTSAGYQGDKTPSMTSFESYMVNKLDGFAENQRNLHDLCVSNFQNFDNRFQRMDTRFQTLDEQIEVVQNQISNFVKTNKGRIFGFVLPNSDLFDLFECCLNSAATADVFNLVFFGSKVYAEN